MSLPKKNHKSTPRKLKPKEGFIVVIAVVISAIVLTIGAGAARLFIQELEFSSDIYLSEKAIFAAESGVEVALLELKTNPVQHVENLNIPLSSIGNTATELTILNRTDRMRFDLGANESQKFRLSQDTDDTLIKNEVLSGSFDLMASAPGKDYEWKFLCQNMSGKTKTLTKRETSGAKITNFYQREDTKNQKFSTWKGIENIDEKSCFFQIKNLDSGSDPISFEFSFSDASKSMTSYKAKITAIGESGGRTKTIQFELLQKNLGSLFDFVLFHY